MAVEHTFRTAGGKLKTARLTPIRAIREQCVHCVQSVYEVSTCAGTDCPLYPFRTGDAHAVPAEQRARLREKAKAASGG